MRSPVGRVCKWDGEISWKPKTVPLGAYSSISPRACKGAPPGDTGPRAVPAKNIGFAPARMYPVGCRP